MKNGFQIVHLAKVKALHTIGVVEHVRE